MSGGSSVQAMNKVELLEKLERQRESFLQAIEGLSDDDLHASGVVGDWSVKDIMAHLTTWEAELVKLLWQARQGVRPTTIHMNNVPVDEQNERWYQALKARPLERVLDDFHGVREQTLRRVQAFSDKDLTDPDRYPWLGGVPLWRWIAGDSFEHEAEHSADILAWRRRSIDK